MSAAYVRTEGIGRNAVTVSKWSPEEIAAWEAKQKGVKPVGLTKEAYMKLKAEGAKDSVIIKQYGMNNAAFYRWKDQNLTEEERKATNLSKTTKTPAERVAESKSTKVQDSKENAKIEAIGTSNEPLVKLKPEYENKTVASKLKDAYKQEIEDEVKEQVRLLAAENKELHAKVFSLEEDNERLEGLSEDKNAEIGALVSNNEDLHATVERLQKELTHVRRELELATDEVDRARLAKPQLAEYPVPQTDDYTRIQDKVSVLETALKMYL